MQSGSRKFAEVPGGTSSASQILEEVRQRAQSKAQGNNQRQWQWYRKIPFLF
jgi:hypothetical protein